MNGLFIKFFKYDNNQFYDYNSNENYHNINLPLLGLAPISITPFDKEYFGIFFKDIDNDSMILMFYPICGNTFNKALKKDKMSDIILIIYKWLLL